MRHNPGKEFCTVLWYTEFKVEIDVQNVGEYPSNYDWGIDWGYYASRKQQSEGRMDLHLMVTSRPGGTEALMFPKRLRDNRVAMGQMEMVERPPEIADGELKLLSGLSEKDEGCIH